jgi:hypothetical protein
MFEKKHDILKEELKEFIEKTIKSNLKSELEQKNTNFEDSVDFSNKIKVN